jgi:hypothetical protein
MSTVTPRLRDAETLANCLRSLVRDAYRCLSSTDTKAESLEILLHRINLLEFELDARRATNLRRWINRLRDKVESRLGSTPTRRRSRDRTALAL